MLADERDLQIVCGEWSLQIGPENSNFKMPGNAEYKHTPETEVVLDIEKIILHPDYSPQKGQIGGNDICVYHVKEEQMAGKIDKNKLYPACLPRKEYKLNLGVTAGWRVTKAFSLYQEGDEAVI